MSRRTIVDTSTLNYYRKIEQEELLRKIYGEIVIPEQVYEEMKRDTAPEHIREWANNLPDWVKVEKVEIPEHIDRLNIGPGEKGVLALAEQDRANTLAIIDDRRACREADRLAIERIGGYGVAFEAESRGLSDSKELHQQLREAGKWIPDPQHHARHFKEWQDRQPQQEKTEGPDRAAQEKARDDGLTPAQIQAIALREKVLREAETKAREEEERRRREQSRSKDDIFDR
jgi:predicted nucleic acid-binding protein